MREFPRTDLQRILAIQLRQVGDVLMCTPTLRALRRAFPEARIDFLVEPGPAKVLAGNPDITEVILRNPNRGWIETPWIISLLRGRRYDVAMDFMANPRSTMISLLSGARLTISFAGGRRSFFYSRAVEPEGAYSAAHKLSLLKPLGINGGKLRPIFVVSETAHAFISGWLDEKGLEPGRFIAIDSTTRRVTRRWTRFGEFADLLKKEHGASCVFLWGPGEEQYVDESLAACSEKHFKAPPTTIDNMAALIESAAALVGTESAPRHIAAALRVPSLTVIGSTRAENWTLPEPIHKIISLDLPCQPCGNNVCQRGNNECVTALEPEAVLEALRQLADNAAPGLGKLLRL